MRYSANIDDITLFFHVTQAEIETASKALDAQGFSNKQPPEVWFGAMVKQLDQQIPGHDLVKKAQTETIGVAVVRPEQGLPDSRLMAPERARLRDGYEIREPANKGSQGPVGVRQGHGMVVSEIRQPSLRSKFEAAELKPLEDDEIEAGKRASEGTDGAPYVTHKGEISLDGKATLAVYQLSDGRRIINEADLLRFFGQFGGL